MKMRNRKCKRLFRKLSVIFIFAGMIGMVASVFDTTHPFVLTFAFFGLFLLGYALLFLLSQSKYLFNYLDALLTVKRAKRYDYLKLMCMEDRRCSQQRFMNESYHDFQERLINEKVNNHLNNFRRG